MKKLVVAVVSAGLVLGAAPAAYAKPWSPPHDPTVEVTGPVLGYTQKDSPRSVSDVRSVREVRKVRTVRQAGES